MHTGFCFRHIQSSIHACLRAEQVFVHLKQTRGLCRRPGTLGTYSTVWHMTHEKTFDKIKDID